MKRPIESDYISLTAYTRALEEYCEALAQPEQEPVAQYIGENWDGSIVQLYEDLQKGTKLYTHPPRRTWAGLTDSEWSDLYETHYDKYNLPKQGSPDGMDYERAIEAKLKELNT